MGYIIGVAGVVASVAVYFGAKGWWRRYRYRKIYGDIGARYISPE